MFKKKDLHQKPDIGNLFALLASLFLMGLFFAFSLSAFDMPDGTVDTAARLLTAGIAAAAFFLLWVLLRSRLTECTKMVILLAFLCLVYSLVCPRGMAPDETNHFLRAFQVSRGGLLPERLENGHGGGTLPAGLEEYTDASVLLKEDELTAYDFLNTALYSPLTYLPQALGILIAGLFTRNVGILFTAARLGNLIVSFFFCFLALKLVPFGRKIFFLIMLFPITLQEMISLAPDGFIIAMSLCLLAAVLRLSCADHPADKKTLLLLTLLCLELSLCKIIYVELLLLLFAVPAACFRSRKEELLWKGGTLALAVVLNLIWLVIAGGYMVEFQPGVDSGAQIRFILTRPWKYLLTLLLTLLYETPFYVMSMCGKYLGAMDIAVPEWVWCSLAILFIVLLFREKCPEGPKKQLPGRKWLYLLTFLGSVLLVFTSLYVQWTAVGAATVAGVQGRYFTPAIALPAVFLLLCRFEKTAPALPEKTPVFLGISRSDWFFYLLLLADNGIALLQVIRTYH